MSHAGLLVQLERMSEAAGKVLDYVAGMDRSAFLGNALVQDAVGMNLVILGEAATRIMDDHPAFIGDHPEVPWRGMRGMRNRVTHGYFGLDFEIVWETVAQAIPTLSAQLPALCMAAAGSIDAADEGVT